MWKRKVNDYFEFPSIEIPFGENIHGNQFIYWCQQNYEVAADIHGFDEKRAETWRHTHRTWSFVNTQCNKSYPDRSKIICYNEIVLHLLLLVIERSRAREVDQSTDQKI